MVKQFLRLVVDLIKHLSPYLASYTVWLIKISMKMSSPNWNATDLNWRPWVLETTAWALFSLLVSCIWRLLPDEKLLLTGRLVNEDPNRTMGWWAEFIVCLSLLVLLTLGMGDGTSSESLGAWSKYIYVLYLLPGPYVFFGFFMGRSAAAGQA